MDNEDKVLFTVIRDHPLRNAPKRTKRFGEWYQWIIGIGNDEVAYVTMTKEAFEALEQGFTSTPQKKE